MKEAQIDRMTVAQIEKKLDAIEEKHEVYVGGGYDVAALLHTVRSQRQRNQFFRGLMERGDLYQEDEYGSFDIEPLATSSTLYA